MPSIEISSTSSSASTCSSYGACVPSGSVRSVGVGVATLSVTVEVMAPPGFGGASCSHSPGVAGGNDAVAALRLRGIEGAVRCGERLQHGLPGDVGGNAGTERHAVGVGGPCV